MLAVQDDKGFDRFFIAVCHFAPTPSWSSGAYVFMVILLNLSRFYTSNVRQHEPAKLFGSALLAKTDAFFAL